MKPTRPQSAEAKQKAELIARAATNPYEFFSFEDCGIILGFSAKAMGRLNAAGAPVAFRKMNPAMVCKWIGDHPALLSKGDEE